MFFGFNRQYAFFSEKQTEDKIMSFKEIYEKNTNQELFKQNVIRQDKFQSFVEEIHDYLDRNYNSKEKTQTALIYPAFISPILTIIQLHFDMMNPSSHNNTNNNNTNLNNTNSSHQNNFTNQNSQNNFNSFNNYNNFGNLSSQHSTLPTSPNNVIYNTFSPQTPSPRSFVNTPNNSNNSNSSNNSANSNSSNSFNSPNENNFNYSNTNTNLNHLNNLNHFNHSNPSSYSNNTNYLTQPRYSSLSNTPNHMNHHNNNYNNNYNSYNNTNLNNNNQNNILNNNANNNILNNNNQNNNMNSIYNDTNINNNTMNNNYNNYNNINEINETFYDEPIKHESKNDYFKKYEMFKLFLEDCLSVYVDKTIRKSALKLSLQYLSLIQCADLRFIQLIISTTDFLAFNGERFNMLKPANFVYHSSMQMTKDVSNRVEEAVYFLSEILSFCFEKQGKFHSMRLLLRYILCVLFPMIPNELDEFIENEFHFEYFSEPNVKCTIIFLKIFLINSTQFVNLNKYPYFMSVFKLVVSSILHMKWSKKDFNGELRSSLKWYFKLLLGTNIQTLQRNIDENKLCNLQLFYTEELRLLFDSHGNNLNDHLEYLSSVVDFISENVWTINDNVKFIIQPLTNIIVKYYFSVLTNCSMNEEERAKYQQKMAHDTTSITLALIYLWSKYYGEGKLQKNEILNGTYSLKSQLMEYYTLPGVLQAFDKMYCHIIRMMTNKVYDMNELNSNETSTPQTTPSSVPFVKSLLSPNYEALRILSSPDEKVFNMYFDIGCPFFTTSLFDKFVGKFDHLSNEMIGLLFELLSQLITIPQLYQEQKIKRNIHMMIIYAFKIIYESQLSSEKQLINLEELFFPMIIQSFEIDDEYIQTLTRQLLIEICYYNPTQKMIQLLSSHLLLKKKDIPFVSIENCVMLLTKQDSNYFILLLPLIKRLKEHFEQFDAKDVVSTQQPIYTNDFISIDKRILSPNQTTLKNVMTLLNICIQMKDFIIPQYVEYLKQTKQNKHHEKTMIEKGIVSYFEDLSKTIICAVSKSNPEILGHTLHFQSTWLLSNMFISVCKTISSTPSIKLQTLPLVTSIINTIFNECQIHEDKEYMEKSQFNFEMILNTLSKCSTTIPNEIINLVFNTTLNLCEKNSAHIHKEQLIFSLLLFILRDNQLMTKLNSHSYTSLMNCIHDMLEADNSANVTVSSLPSKPMLYEYSEKEYIDILIQKIIHFNTSIDCQNLPLKELKNCLHIIKDEKIISFYRKKQNRNIITMEIRDCLGRYSFVIHDHVNKIQSDWNEQIQECEQLEKIEYQQHSLEALEELQKKLNNSKDDKELKEIKSTRQSFVTMKTYKPTEINESKDQKQTKEPNWLETDINSLLQNNPEFYEGVLNDDSKDFKQFKQVITQDREQTKMQNQTFEKSWMNPFEIEKQLFMLHSIPKQFNEIPYITEKIAKIVLSIFNVTPSTFKSLSIHSTELNKKLQKLDDINVRERYEVGIVFVGKNEFVDEIMTSYGVSEEYEMVTNSLGKIIGTSQFDDPITQKLDVTYPVIYYNDPLREIIFHDITKIPNQHEDIKMNVINNLVTVFYSEYLFDPNVFEELRSQFAIVIQPYRDGMFIIDIYTKKCECWGSLQTENIISIDELGNYIRETIVCLWKEFEFLQLKKKNKQHPLLVRKQMINKIQPECQINNYIEFMNVIESFVNGNGKK